MASAVAKMSSPYRLFTAPHGAANVLVNSGNFAHWCNLSEFWVIVLANPSLVLPMYSTYT